MVLRNHPTLSIATEKACLSKQLPWRAVGDPRQACSRSRVQVLAPASALRTLFSPPSLPSSEKFFFVPSPTTPVKVLGLIVQSWPTLYIDRSDQKKVFYFLSVQKNKNLPKNTNIYVKKVLGLISSILQ